MYLLPVALLALWATWCAALASPDDGSVSNLEPRQHPSPGLTGENYAFFTLERLSTSGGSLAGVAIEVILPSQGFKINQYHPRLPFSLRVDTGSTHSWVMSESVRETNPEREGRYWNPSVSGGCTNQCYNYPSGLVKVSTYSEPVKLGLGKRAPNIDFPLEIAYEVHGRLARAASSEMGDGSIGLDPIGASWFASALAGKKMRSSGAIIPNDGQLYINMVVNDLRLGKYDDDGLIWFALDKSDVTPETPAWTVSARADTSHAEGQAQGLVYFATGWPDIHMAQSDVVAYFAQGLENGVFIVTQQHQTTGVWYVNCDVDTKKLKPLVVHIQGRSLEVKASFLVGDYIFDGNAGQRFCRAKLQNTPDAALQLGVTTVLGLAFLEQYHIVFDHAGAQVGVKRQKRLKRQS